MGWTTHPSRQCRSFVLHLCTNILPLVGCMEGSGANTNEGCGEGSINKLASLAKVRLIGGRDIGALRTLHNVSHGVTTLVGATQPNDYYYYY
jgi:hypothetical protein